MPSTLLATIDDIPIYWDAAKLSWRSGAAIDADGSPRAYGPHNTGLDWTANAGSPGNWFGVATDKRGEPVIQGPQDPHPGFYVSTTAYENEDFTASDPRRYLDSEGVPYVVIPGKLRTHTPGIVLGCKAEVTNMRTGVCVTAVVGDVGPSNKIGEVSIALAHALGIPSDPKTGGTTQPILDFEVFPGVPAKVNGVQYRLIPA